MPENYHAWFKLKSVPQVGNVTFRRLLRRFESPENILSATLEELQNTPGVTPSAAAAIKSKADNKEADELCRALERSNSRLITISSSEYPLILKQLADAPPYLFAKGKFPENFEGIAIVGSRRATRYGLSSAESLSASLALKGLTIVSGFARGIDTAAHTAALKNNGSTVAVLGCGTDIIYPSENRKLYYEIAERGIIISEFPPGTSPLSENFPRRNRIISGLSKGVIIVEAAKRSGTLITANYALEQGREVYAVPGNINQPNSSGCNWLIKSGARLVDTPEDILLDPSSSFNKSITDIPEIIVPELEGDDRKVYELLSNEPLDIDQITTSSGLTPAALSSILLNLELKGVIIQLPGKLFSVA